MTVKILVTYFPLKVHWIVFLDLVFLECMWYWLLLIKLRLSKDAFKCDSTDCIALPRLYCMQLQTSVRKSISLYVLMTYVLYEQPLISPIISGGFRGRALESPEGLLAALRFKHTLEKNALCPHYIAWLTLGPLRPDPPPLGQNPPVLIECADTAGHVESVTHASSHACL